MKTSTRILIFFLLSTVSLSAQNFAWKDWSSVTEANEVEPKKMLVYVYTDWCAVCKKLEKGTFLDSELSNYMNDTYRLVKFNAETSQDIKIRNKVYSKKTGRYNELAIALTNGSLVFPSLVFLDENYNIIQVIEGYQGPQRMLKISNYFASNAYKSLPWDQFSNQYDQERLNASSVSAPIYTTNKE